MYEFTYTAFSKGQNIEMKRSVVVRSCRGGGSVKVVCSKEVKQFCILILVMVQKPVPVIKFHRDMHNKTDISDYHLYFSNTVSISIF